MQLWIVNHPYRHRRWREFVVKALENPVWCRGYVWAEWVDLGEGPARLPSRPPDEWNVDPLIVGPDMYFDYCRKRTGAKRNACDPNSLEAGDLVLFGCVRQNRIIIDTIFPIGAYRLWPTRGLPPWEGIDRVARKVHFHAAAHEGKKGQHPEVHQNQMVQARSYRAASYRTAQNASTFAWVPFRTEPTTGVDWPFELYPEGNAYRILEEIYGDERPNALQRRMKGSFSVRRTNGDQARSLFGFLLREATEQGFSIAVTVGLID